MAQNRKNTAAEIKGVAKIFAGGPEAPGGLFGSLCLLLAQIVPRRVFTASVQTTPSPAMTPHSEKTHGQINLGHRLRSWQTKKKKDFVFL